MSLGTPEMIVIFVLVLLLFGPNKLPELARGIGKGLREFRKISSEVQNQIAQLAEDEPAPRAPRTSSSRTVESTRIDDAVTKNELDGHQSKTDSDVI